MTKPLYLLLTLWLLVVSLLILPASVNAQGTYDCGLFGVGYYCATATTNCDPGNKPIDNLCTALSTATCTVNNPHDCILDTTCGDTNQLCCAGFCRSTSDTCGISSTLGPGYWCVSTTSSGTPPTTGIFPIKRYDAAFCDSGSGVNTAIGCIPVGDINTTISRLLAWGLGIAGGIAFILIIIAGFQYATSAGDPKRTKAAQELLTSALAGLILIAFSVLILNFLGVSVLRLDRFGFNQ